MRSATITVDAPHSFDTAAASKPIGPRAHHRDRLAQAQIGQLHRVQQHGQRLHERRVGKGHSRGHRQQVAARHQGVFAQRSGHVAA